MRAEGGVDLAKENVPGVDAEAAKRAVERHQCADERNGERKTR
jgi:hypothetical protein